jgi:hypothetical protein
MRQCATNEAVRPCLIRMKANGVKTRGKNNQKNNQYMASLHRFGKPGNGGAVPVFEANRCGNQDGEESPGSGQPKQGEWWLQVRLEHPYVAIELIESYKKIAGVPLGEVTYNLQLFESDVRHGPSPA